MKQKGLSILSVIITILLLTSLSIFGYWAYLKFFSNTKLNLSFLPKSSASPTPAPSPSRSPTAWQQYSDSTFSFQFPPNAAVEQTSSNLPQINFWGPKQPTLTAGGSTLIDGYVITINNLGSAATTNIDNQTQTNRESYQPHCQTPATPNVTAISSTSIGGETTSTYSIICPTENTDEYFVSDGKNVYEIRNYYTGDAQSLIEYKQVTNQILSTLKFTQ
jgi:hypothetical protein